MTTEPFREHRTEVAEQVGVERAGRREVGGVTPVGVDGPVHCPIALGGRLPDDDIGRIDDDIGRIDDDIGRIDDDETDEGPRSPSYFRTRLAVADAVAVIVGAAVAFAAWIMIRDPSWASIWRHAALFATAYPIWLIAIVSRKLLVARAVHDPAEELRRIWSAAVLASMLTIVDAFVIGFETASRGLVLALFVCIGLMLSLERWAARSAFRRLRSTGQIARRIAVIGTDSNAVRTMQTLRDDPSHGYVVVGYIGDNDIGTAAGCRRLGTLAGAVQLLREHDCTGAILSLASVDPEIVNRLARDLTEDGFHVTLSTSLNDIHVGRLRTQSIDRGAMLYVEPVIRSGWRAVAKRAFDMLTASVALVLALPVLAVAALAIRLDSHGPVFFRQERVGLAGQTFRILKLRTMHQDAEARLADLQHANESDGALFKIAKDPRITRVGRFLRKTSIDEIPQFWNVLRGEMSVVGPRPALPSEVAQWDAETAERLRVLPGITGLWQVEGRAVTDFATYKRLDLFYVDNWSLAHDLVIVLKTFKAVVSGRGAA